MSARRRVFMTTAAFGLAATFAVTALAPASATTIFVPPGSSAVAALTGASPQTLAGAAPVRTTTSGTNAIHSTVAGTTVTVPVHPAAGVLLTNAESSMSIGLPYSNQASSASSTAPGVVAYDNKNGSTTVPVVENDGSLVVSTVIARASAPSTYTYTFGAAAGTTVVLAPNGGAAVVTASGAITAAIAPPWAKDSHGVALPTHYSVNGSTLTQVVDLTSPGIAFPVVADPKVYFYWWGSAVKISHAQTVSVNNTLNRNPVEAAGALCGFVVLPIGVVACTAIVEVKIFYWKQAINDAATHGKCAQLEAAYLTSPVLWNLTSETC